MSDYAHTKAVFYPVTEEDLKVLGVDSVYDLDIDDRYKHLFDKYSANKKKNYFDVEGMINYKTDESSSYLIYVKYYSYGDDCGDYGTSRPLTPEEQEKFKPLFEQILPNIDPSKFKYVDYCYYNCSECHDYYVDPSGNDDLLDDDD